MKRTQCVEDKVNARVKDLIDGIKVLKFPHKVEKLALYWVIWKMYVRDNPECAKASLAAVAKTPRDAAGGIL